MVAAETEEFGESQWYRTRESPNIEPSMLWADWASKLMKQYPLEGTAPDTAPFLSTHFVESARGYSEIAAVLGMLQLPAYPVGPVEWTREGDKMSMTAAAPCVVFHKELLSAESKVRSDTTC